MKSSGVNENTHLNVFLDEIQERILAFLSMPVQIQAWDHLFSHNWMYENFKRDFDDGTQINIIEEINASCHTNLCWFGCVDVAGSDVCQ